MRASVTTSFNTFTTKFEGRVPWMYLDIKGLVTVAVGNLIDPVDAALGLPFVHKTSKAAATKDEIRAEWTMLKGKQDLAQKGHKACEAITDLRMTDQGMDNLVLAKLNANEAVLKKTFPAWDSWSADAQLGVLSMAWAMGPGFPAHWTTFTAAAKAEDWAKAAANCKINETGNPGVKPRNEADVVLFTNAAAVKSKGLDPAKLYYPTDARTVSAPTPTPTTVPTGTGTGTGSGDHVPVDTADPMPPEDTGTGATDSSTAGTTGDTSTAGTTGDTTGDASTGDSTDTSGDTTGDTSTGDSTDTSGDTTGDTSTDGSTDTSGDSTGDSTDTSGDASGDTSGDTSGDGSTDGSGDTSTPTDDGSSTESADDAMAPA